MCSLTTTSTMTEDTVSIVTGGYDVELVVADEDETYTCPICLLILCQPVQLPCGHVFCSVCWKGCKKEEDGCTKCPVDRESISDNQVFPDRNLERRIRNVMVRCTNVKKGCKWEGELNSQKEHVETKCMYHPIECSQDCKQHVPRGEMELHFKTCDNTGRPCAYADVGCPFQGTKEENEMHEKTVLSLHLNLAMQKVRYLDNQLATQEEVSAKVKKEFDGQLAHMEEEFSSQLVKQEKYSTDIKAVFDLMDKKQKEAFNQTNDELEKLRKFNLSHLHVYTWHLHNFHNTCKTGVYSDPFSLRGYQLRLYAQCESWTSHNYYVYIYLQIGKGPYDENLLWPLMNICTATFIHPNNHSKNVALTLNPYDHPNNGRKPTAAYNQLMQFRSESSLRNTSNILREEGFMTDNYLYIEFKIQ